VKIKVLGCSGGIGGQDVHTTSFLVDDDILIDAGTGVADLSIEALAKIDHVFITHTHLDHIACLPLLIDTVADVRTTPLQVHAIGPVIDLLRKHVFNWSIWPDFSEIPSVDAPVLEFIELQIDVSVDMGQGRRITPWPANHTVPAVAYAVEAARGGWVFSGDTASCPPLWDRINRIDNLKYLIMECAFPNRQADLAKAAKHLCPQTLAIELSLLQRPAELFITHLKPGMIEVTMDEVTQAVGGFNPRMLENNWTFEL
jgi:ribonuclease BN (tRNA processing enzyme)